MNRNKQITVAILAGTFVGMSYKYVFKAGVWLGKIMTYKDIINYVDGIKKGKNNRWNYLLYFSF